MLSTLLKWKGSDWTFEDCKGKKLMRVDCDVGDNEQQQASISWFNTCALGLPAKYRDTKFSQHVKNAFCINPSHVALVLDNFDKHIMKDENKKTASYEFINSLQVDAGHSNIFNIIVVLSDPSNVFWMLDKFKGIATHVVVKWTEDEAVALLDAATVSPGPAVLDTMNNKQLSVHELMESTGSARMALDILNGNAAIQGPDNIVREEIGRMKRKKMDEAVDIFQSLQSFMENRPTRV
jgi:hypothetical protein